MSPGLLGGLLSRGPSEQTVAELESAVETSLNAGEQTVHRLPGSGPLVHETGDERTEHGANGALAVVTDHRVLFVTVDDETTVVDLPHTDIGSVDLDSSLFSTLLTVECWESGSYRFPPADGEAAAAAEYVETASDCWQFVETLLEELEGHAERIRTAIQNRDGERLTAVLAEAEETTDELAERVHTAGLERALGDRVQTARRSLQRTRLQTRLERARSLVAEAESRHLYTDETADYTGAYERYERAYEQLSTARSVAVEHDIDTAAVDSTLEVVRERVDLLARQPVGLAKQATERALGTDDPAVRVETMAAALDHYHDALTVCWGTELGRPYSKTELRFRVALLADGLVDARRRYATRLEAAGDRLTASGDEPTARARYGAAVEQLDAALDTAREFRVPDPDPVERERERLVRKRETTG